MSILTRKRAIVGGVVAAFVVILAVIGIVSRSTSSTDSPTASATAATPSTTPTAQWYWTMAVSPLNPNAVVLGTSSGLYRSLDVGRTWKPTGPKDFDATSVVTMGRSIVAGGASTTNPNVSPVIRKGATRAAADGSTVLVRSSDGGASWRRLHPTGLPDAAIQSLAVDPTDDRVVYALLNTGALYRSSDGAGSFQLVSSKLGIPPWAIAITRDQHYVGGDMDTGAYASANGKSWRHTSFADASGDKMVMEYAVQPTAAGRILMTVYGIEISTDGGKTWHTSLSSKVMFGPVAWVPQAPAVAYAIGFDGSFWRSGDGGKTWHEVS